MRWLCLVSDSTLHAPMNEIVPIAINMILFIGPKTFLSVWCHLLRPGKHVFISNFTGQTFFNETKVSFTPFAGLDFSSNLAITTVDRGRLSSHLPLSPRYNDFTTVFNQD